MGAFFGVLALVLVGFLVLWLLLRAEVRRYASPAAQMEQLRAEVERLVVDLNQTTERNILLLEDRISGLTELLSQTDKKMDLLRREAEKREMGTRVYARLGNSRPQPVEGRRTPSVDRQTPSVDRQTPPEETSARQGPDAPPGSFPAAFAEPRQDEVVRLYRAGFSSALISGRTGIPRGEVELIISLEEGKDRT